MRPCVPSGPPAALLEHSQQPPMRPCASCTGECCRHYFVNLNGHDVRRLAAATHLPPAEFVELGQEHAGTPAGFRLDATHATFAMVLAKHHGADGRQQCIFLQDHPDGSGRCGVYGARPAACRAFPARLRDGEVIFREHIVCPDDAWAVDEPELSAWRAVLQRSRMEWEIFGEVVRRWNDIAAATPRGEMRTPNEFYDFLFDRYARVEALEAAMPPAQLAAIVAQWGQPVPGSGELTWQNFAVAVKEAIQTSV